MDIGTAKALPDRRSKELKDEGTTRNDYLVQGIPHHLLDIRWPGQSYSVALFQRDAERTIRDIVRRGRLPIIVGGTGLYIRALVENFAIPRVGGAARLRASYAGKSHAALFRLLKKLDPETAKVIDRKNKRRLIRALEVCIFTGQRFSELRAMRAAKFAMLQIGLERTREALYRRIDARVRAMFRGGLIDEVRTLIHRHGTDIEPLRGLIYREVVAWLAASERERMTLRELEYHIMAANHRYARHQLAWFKRDNRAHWVRTSLQAEKLVRKFLNT